MDALNFLFQQPTLNWFDFYLAPSKLIPHLNQTKPEPSADQLICQFCDQARNEDLLAMMPDFLPEDLEYHRKKAEKLWCLALKVCAHMKWNLQTLGKTDLHLYYLKCMIQQLGLYTLGTNDLASILHGGPTVLDVPDSIKTTTILLCARWVLKSMLDDNYYKPPPRITVSNPSAQIDPSVPLSEANDAIVQELQSLGNLCLDMFNRIPFDMDFAIPTPDCFVIPDENDQGLSLPSVIEFDWTKPDVVPGRLMYSQAIYELGEYHFQVDQWDMARACMEAAMAGFSEMEAVNGHFTFDRSAFFGYCRALDIEVPNMPPIREEASLLSKYEEEEDNFTQTSLPRYAQLHSSNFLDHIIDLFAIMENHVQFLRLPENASTFCLALKSRLPSDLPQRTRVIVESYLRFLCACHPALLDTLKGCGVFGRLQFDDATLRDFAVPPFKSTDSEPDLSLLSKLEPPWRVLSTFDSSELKAVAQRAEPNRVSCHFVVPSTIQPLLQKLPPSIYQDVVALATIKAEQLAEIGDTAEIPSLIDLASHEARSGLGDTQPEFACEMLRLELVRWHDLLQRCPDLQVMGDMTIALAPKVKGFINSYNSKSSAASWELCMFATSFLLNTCDYEFIILHCPSFHRFANFGKVLAGLCYEVQKAGVNVRTMAREFYDIMLATVMDTMQYKRGTGQLGREPAVQLLTRAYFTAILKNLKEACAVSLLLSFFVKIYNGFKNGIFEIFAEHVSMWPTTAIDPNGVNEAYLSEVLLITLENALQVNPNSAFFLRARGDFDLANDQYESAFQYYLQSTLSCSDAFTKPLPENVVDDKLVLNMVKCAGRMECHTIEAMLCQLLREPNYGLAVKALQEPLNYDGMDIYYGMIWDPALLELMIYALDKSGQHYGRVDIAMRAYSQQDNNIHNDESVVKAVASRRRKAFLTSICRLFF